MRLITRVFFTITVLASLSRPVPAAVVAYVTTLTSISSGGVLNNYDSVTGLSHNAGNCYLQAGGTGPCATLTSTPASNTLGLTSASVAILNGVAFDPQNGISGYGAASASADLATGLLRAYTNGPNCSVPNATGCISGGFAAAQFQDTVTFNNTTGQSANIIVDWSFDGTTISLGTSPSITMDSLFCFTSGSSCAGNPNSALHQPLNSGQAFVYDYSNGTVVHNTLPTLGYVSSHLIAGVNSTSETFEGVIALAPGVTHYSLNAYMEASCLISTCDFSHTGAFTLNDIPSGVTFTSGSGVLLSADAPEPGTWGLGWCGAALLAIAKRRCSRLSRPL